MCVVAFIPCILSNVFDLSKLSFAGSSIIIITGVFIETKDKFLAEIQSELNHSKISLFQQRKEISTKISAKISAKEIN